MQTHMVQVTRRNFLSLLASAGMAAIGIGALGGCSGTAASGGSSAASSDYSALSIDSAKWSYDADNDVYYQIGLPYCTKPQATDYESYGIYVPGAYFTGEQNADGTYTCTVNADATVGDFSAATAPVVMPVNTAGYSAQAAPTEYSYDGLEDYLKAGFVYVFAGCRGRDNGYDEGGNLEFSGGAPWGVTDLKAAVRALRYNASSLPGDMQKVFSFGMSGGGAQSALFGVAGDAPGYKPYLESIGAPLTDADGAEISDALFGSMCWCPITNLDYADEAYEWNMGQFSTSDTRAEGTFTAALSKDMAAAWAGYINKLGLKGADGKKLELEEGGEGVWTAGSYYEYIVGEVERSLNNFLKDTEFPYTPSNEFNADMGAGGGGMRGMGPGGNGGQSPDGNMPQDGQRPDGKGPQGEGGARGGARLEGKGPQGGGKGQGSSDTTTYETAKDYIAHLNEDGEWVTYDEKKNTATITGLSGFVNACKTPSKSVGAFDDLSRSQGENTLFGNDENDALHFDACMAALLEEHKSEYAALENWNDSYPADYANDLAQVDSLGTGMQARVDLYNPLYYLCDYYDGAGVSTASKHWRIRSGIEQGDTACTTEINLALALQMVLGEDAVDFETVWGKGHTMAERSGNSTDNFIAWVKDCCA